MPGVNWDERERTDWLASNGRWYPETDYPRGWSTSALPPAPGHGGVGSILRRFVGTASPEVSAPSASSSDVDVESGDDGFAAGWTVESEQARPSTPRSAPTGAPGAAIVPTGRRVAEATISPTAQRPPATQGLPAPPGRLGAPPKRTRAVPAPPTQPRTPPPAPSPSATPQPRSFDVVAGDLGKVLGTAKRRVSKAINEAAES